MSPLFGCGDVGDIARFLIDGQGGQTDQRVYDWIVFTIDRGRWLRRWRDGAKVVHRTEEIGLVANVGVGVEVVANVGVEVVAIVVVITVVVLEAVIDAVKGSFAGTPGVRTRLTRI